MTKVRTYRIDIDEGAQQGDAIVLGTCGGMTSQHLGTAASLDAGTCAGNVPILDINGKLPDDTSPSSTMKKCIYDPDNKQADVYDYRNFDNTPEIPVVNDPTVTFTQGGITVGSISLNQSGNTTIGLMAGGVSAGAGIDINCSEVSVKYDSCSLGIDANNKLQVNDYSAIASGAAAGATAVQPGDLCSVATSGQYCDLSGQPTIPTDNCQLANSCGYITNAVNDLQNYYLKCETYQKCEVDNLISNFGGFEVVSTLPTTDIKTNVIYLLGPIGTGSDKYEEWIYYNNTWTKIGETTTDLSNYAKCCDIPTDNCQLGNTCGYTTCTGTLVASDLNDYTKTCDLASVSLSGQYCDLTGTPILCNVATSGQYCDLSGTPVLCSVATSGQYCDLTGTPAIPAALTAGNGISITSNCINVNYDGSTIKKNDGNCLYADLTGYANDACVVHLAGGETITGQKTFTQPTKIQSGDATGALILGANLNASVVTANNRKMARMGMPSFDNTAPVTIISGDSQNSAVNLVDFGGNPLATGTSAPDFIRFVVAKTHGSTCGDKINMFEVSNYEGADVNYLQHKKGISLNAKTMLSDDAIPTAGDCGCLVPSTRWVQGELGSYAKSCDLSTVATSGKYCDLTGAPTLCTVATTGEYCDLTGVPDLSCKQDVLTLGTNLHYDGDGKLQVGDANNDLQGMRYVCASYLKTSSGNMTGTPTAIPVLDASGWMCKQTPACFLSNLGIKTVATSGCYCDLTGTPTLSTVATSGCYCDLTGTPTIPTDNCQLANSCGYTTCTGTLVDSSLVTINGCCLVGSGDICIQGGVTSVNGCTGAVCVSEFSPTSSGSTGQYLTKTSSGYDWATITVTGGDMSYCDFDWAAKSGASVTLDLNSTITPSANFTVNKPSTIKEGQTYVLRVNNGSTAYTMSLGTGISNPWGTDLTLTPNGIDQFVFLATSSSTLELQNDVDDEVRFVTQDEYDALPVTKETDGRAYFIVEEAE